MWRRSCQSRKLWKWRTTRPGLRKCFLILSNPEPWRLCALCRCRWWTRERKSRRSRSIQLANSSPSLRGGRGLCWWWEHLLEFIRIMSQVVFDLEKRKRVKLLRCAEFRTLEVSSMSPSWSQIPHVTCHCPPASCTQVVSLAFSHDSKYLLAQGGAPDHQLVYFFWEKGKVGGKLFDIDNRRKLLCQSNSWRTPKAMCIMFISVVHQYSCR